MSHPRTEGRDPVSVIIRNRNEAETLRLILDALAEQSAEHEVVVVDNESTDGSQELARSCGARICTVPTSEFTYGGSLNRGMAATAHEAVVVLSGHSIPIGPDFLRIATAPLQSPEVAAVRLLRADKTRELSRWSARPPITPPVDVDRLVKGGPVASGCVFRRSVWEDIPFDETVDSDEDKVWAVAAVSAGHTVATAPAVYAYSRHLRTIDALQRESRSALGVYRATGHRAEVGLGSTVRAVAVGVAQAVLAPTWRLVDNRLLPLRCRRPVRRGALWRSGPGPDPAIEPFIDVEPAEPTPASAPQPALPPSVPGPTG